MSALDFFRSVRGNYEIKSGEVGGFDIVKYRKGLMSTVGYYLNPGGAHKLINNVNPIFYPVDIYIYGKVLGSWCGVLWSKACIC